MASNKEDFEIVKNPKGKAAFWTHFGLKRMKKDGSLVENFAVCRKCRAEVKYSGGTTNLSSHIRRHHPGIDVSASPISTGVKPVFHTSKPRTIADAFGQTYGSNSPKAQDVTTKIARFIIKDLRPYRIVESVEFKEMIKALDPRYKVPSRKQFSEEIIPSMYRKVAGDVKEEIQKAEQVAITTDGWTSRATESFVTITSCHIDCNWEMRNHVLQTRVLSESHTGIYVYFSYKYARWKR